MSGILKIEGLSHRYNSSWAIRDINIDIARHGAVGLLGANGAGKTSIIEAIHLMGYGRSFRGRVRDGMIRSNTGQCEIFIRWLEGEKSERQAGVNSR